MKQGSKYYPLYEHLTQRVQDEITLTFNELEEILGSALPGTARTQRAWWSNRSSGGLQAAAWMEAGYHTENLELENERVTFRKPVFRYEVQRDGDTILWNGEMIKALRHHMSYTQNEMAHELGVRQQTISEWEKGVYTPKRAMSKLFNFVAERAAFDYGETE